MRVAQYTIRAGDTSRLAFLHARSGDGAAPATGLRHDSPGAAAAYARDHEGLARAIRLVPGAPGEHRSGGFCEVDPDLLPGVYQFGIPDEALDPGASRVLLLFRFFEVAIDRIEISLVSYDPLDDWCIGVEGLANKRRHEFLRRALPRLTEKELALGEEQERRLSQQLDSEGR